MFWSWTFPGKKRWVDFGKKGRSSTECCLYVSLCARPARCREKPSSAAKWRRAGIYSTGYSDSLVRGVQGDLHLLLHIIRIHQLILPHQTLLADKPASDVQSVYDSLLALYQYTLGRLQLLEIVGTNAVLTDALLSRLVELDAENSRFLASERKNRETLTALELQFQTQQRANQAVENALQGMLSYHCQRLNSHTCTFPQTHTTCSQNRKKSSTHKQRSSQS